MKRREKIESIIAAHFSHLLDWKPPTFIAAPGPQSTGVFDLFIEKRDESIAKAQSAISLCDDDDLETLHRLEGKGLSYHLKKSSDQDREAWNNATQLKPPVWFAGGFGVDGYQADFNYWAQMERWTVEQCIALSVGVEPEKLFLDEKIESLIDYDVLDFIKKRATLIKQKFEPYGNHPNMFMPSPDAFCEWAVEKGVDVPSALLASVAPTTAITTSPLEARERDSLLKLTIGLAMGGYGYNPEAIKSPVPNQIRSDMQLRGLDMDADTIRKWLREAATVLPEVLKDE